MVRGRIPEARQDIAVPEPLVHGGDRHIVLRFCDDRQRVISKVICRKPAGTAAEGISRPGHQIVLRLFNDPIPDLIPVFHVEFPAEDQIQPAVVEPGGQLLVAEGEQHHLNMRILLQHFPQHRRQQIVHRDPVENADADHRGEVGRGGLRLLNSALILYKDRLQLLRQDLSARSELQLPPAPVKELDAQLVLHHDDLPAQSRLRYIQQIGRLCKAEAFRHRQKIVDLNKVHVLASHAPESSRSQLSKTIIPNCE